MIPYASMPLTTGHASRSLEVSLPHGGGGERLVSDVSDRTSGMWLRRPPGASNGHRAGSVAGGDRGSTPGAPPPG